MRYKYCLFTVFVLFSCTDFEPESYKLPEEATLETREVFRISEPVEGAYFSFIWKIHVLSSGNLIIHDIRQTRLFELTPDANFVNFIGREGRGPGEIMQARDSYVTINDSLHVFDPMNARHQVFVKNEKNEWEYSRERPFRQELPIELKSQLPFKLIKGPDKLLSGVFLIQPQEISPSYSGYDTLKSYYQYVANLDHNIVQRDSISRLKTVSDILFYHDGDGSTHSSSNARAGHLFYSYDPANDEVIYVTNSSNKIMAIDSAGVEYIKGNLPYERFPADQEAIEESLLFWKNNGIEGMIRVLRRAYLPHEPYYWNVILAEDRLWVQLARSEETKPNWIITSLDGEILESFHGPKDISIRTLTIHGNRMYGSIEDADGAVYLVGYELGQKQ